MIDYVKLFNDFSIPYWTEGNNCSFGFINVKCVFCDDHSNHLGIKFETGAVSCWRCGPHGRRDALCKILGVNDETLGKILQSYQTRGVGTKGAVKESLKAPENVKIPLVEELNGKCFTYLEKRGFDTFQLIRDYRIKSTKTPCFFEGIDLKCRIFIPIYWKNTLVSWQTRAVVDTSKLRYITCPAAFEVIPHKEIIYGIPLKRPPEKAIITEGIPDSWKFGEYGFSTFGVNYTKEQVRIISSMFRKVFVLFDNDKIGRTQARKLTKELHFRGIDALDCTKHYLSEDGDPAGMSDTTVRTIIENLNY